MLFSPRGGREGAQIMLLLSPLYHTLHNFHSGYYLFLSFFIVFFPFREQRVTGVLIFLFIGLSVFMTPLLSVSHLNYTYILSLLDTILPVNHS